MFDKIYIINIKSHTEKRDKIIEELESARFNNYEFIEAVEGIDLPHTDTLCRTRILSRTFIDPNGIFTKNIIGCALSHQKAYNKFLEDGYENCLILEDDIKFEADFFKGMLNGLIDNVKSEMPIVPWDIFIWGLVGENIPHYPEQHAIGFPHLNSIREYKKYSPDWAAHAYQITRDGARKLIANNTPVRFAADVNLETSGSTMYCTPWGFINQVNGDVNRFTSQKMFTKIETSISDIGLNSATAATKDKGSYCGNSMYDIYFSGDRSIMYEKKKWLCEISKEISMKSVEFKQFTDVDGNTRPHWCHINL